MDDYTRDVVRGPIDLNSIPIASQGMPGTVTTRTYAVSLPRWARWIRHAAEAVVRWTQRFERHTRIG